jgi:hypothetical protein
MAHFTFLYGSYLKLGNGEYGILFYVLSFYIFYGLLVMSVGVGRSATNV